MRRWTLRILVSLIILLLLLAAAVQVALWSDWPRRMVVTQLQRDLGLRVNVESLSVGWFGGSSMRNVTLSLPLSEQAMLNVPNVRMRHASVPALILGREVDLREIDLENAELVARQDVGGRWNVQEAIERLNHAGTENGAPNPAPAALPRITVVNATVQIIDRNNRRAVAQAVSLSGYPENPLLWKYDVEVPGQLQLRGQIASGARWKHQAAVTVQHVDPWIADWIATWPDNASLDGQWAGQFEDDGAISGRLEIERSQFGSYAAQGALVVQGTASNLRIRPDRLIIHADEALIPNLRTTGGSAMLVGSTLRTEGLRFAIGGNGMLDVDGEWNFFAGTASVAADWENVESLPAGAMHSGTLAASLSQPWPNQLKLQARIEARGSALGGDFAGDLNVIGEGAAWNALNLQFNAPGLSWQGKRSIAFRDVVASITTQGNSIVLNNIRAAAQGHVAGNGAINLDTGDWRLWLDAGEWTLPRDGDASVNFMINAWGNSEKIRLEELYVRSSDVDAVLSGWYEYGLPKPLDADVYVMHLPDIAAGGDAAQATTEPSQVTPERRRIIAGKLRGQGHLNGTVVPLDLSVNGTLFGRNVFIRQRPLGDVALILAGTINRDEAQLESQELALLGGRWRLRGYYPLGQTPRAGQLSIEVQDLPLAEISDMTESKVDFAGTLDGRWILNVPEWSAQRLDLDGSFEIADVRAPHFAARHVEGKIAMSNGVLSVDPVVMQSGGSDGGSAEGRLSINVANWEKVQVQAAATRWPVSFDRSSISGILSGTTNLDVDLSSGAIFGPLEITADVSRDGDPQSATPLGQVRLASQFTQRIIDVGSLNADVLGGRMHASATIHLDNLLLTIAQAEWQDVSADRLVEMFPRRLNGLTGSFSGAAKLAPTRDERALEPLRLSVAVESGNNATIRGAQLGNAEFTAYVNASRFVLDRASVLFAGGTVDLWARTTRHATQRFFTQLIVRFDNLDLNQLVHMGAPSADAFPGRLGGNVTLVGSPYRLDNAFGQGAVHLTQSEIGNSDIVEPLYFAMSLGKNFDEPTGSASARLQLQDSRLDVSQLRYFNRGTEVRADATIADAWNLANSPISGFAVGSARPLKDIKLPWLADVDQIFAVLQANVTSVRIGGTVRNPQAQIIPFAQIGASMRRFLFGDVKHDTLDK